MASPRIVGLAPTIGAFGVPAVAACYWSCRARPDIVLPRTVVGRTFVTLWFVAAALGEEVVFRSWLTSGRASARSIGLSSVAFAALHWRRGGARAAVTQLANGSAWAACTAANRSVLWPSIAHSAYNLALVLGSGRRDAVRGARA